MYYVLKKVLKGVGSTDAHPNVALLPRYTFKILPWITDRIHKTKLAI